MSDSDSDSATSADESVAYVERLLYQSEGNGRPLYLVKWSGYGIERCTWEPAESFIDPSILVGWEMQREAGDVLDENTLATVQARMDAYEKKEARKRCRKEFERASGRPPKSNPPGVKRPRASRSPSIKVEAPETSGVKETQTAEQPRSPNPPVAQAGSAQVTSTQVDSYQPSATTVDPKPNITPPVPLPLAQGEGAPRPITTAKQGGNIQTNQDPKPTKSYVTPGPGLNQNTLRGPNTSAAGKQQGNAQAAPMATYTGKGKAGQMFKNMREQNRYTKLASREPAPDISKLDLREADAWPVSGLAEPASKIHGPSPKDGRGSSPLFFSEDETELPQTDNQETRGEACKSPRQSVPGEPPLRATEAAPSIPLASLAPDKSAANWGSSQWPIRNMITDTRPISIKSKSRRSMSSTALRTPFAERRPSPSRPRSTSAHDYDDVGGPSTRVQIPSSHSPPKASTTSSAQKSRWPVKGSPNHELPTNLDVYLLYGHYDVGLVTLAGIPPWLSRKLGKTTGGRHPTIAFKKHWMMNGAEFSDFSADKLHIQEHGTFPIQARDDARRAVERLCKDMKDNDLIAVWEYLPHDSLVLVLSWKDSSAENVNEFETPLRISLRNKRPGIYLGNHPGAVDYRQHPSGERDTRFPGAIPKSAQPLPRSAVAEDAGVYTQSPFKPSAPTRTMTLAKWPSASAHSQVQSPVNSLTSAPGAATILANTPAVERSPSSANDNTLPGGVDRSRHELWVMICFGKSNPVDAEAVRQWLCTHNRPYRVFIDTEKNGWDKFRDGISSKDSAILFHEMHRAYCDLPLFHKVLERQHLSCYEVPSQSPLGKLKEPKLGQEGGWTKLFPRGSVFCITEDTLNRHLQDVLWFMTWFEYRSRKETLRLALPPDISSWLLRRAKDNVGGKISDKYINIVQSVHRLRARSSEVSWSNTSRRDDPDEFVHARPWDHSSEIIQSPPPSPFFGDWDRADFGHEAVRARDKSLIKWFVGWAAANSPLYRKFFVLDATHDNGTENHSWHISFRHITSWKQDIDRIEQREHEISTFSQTW
ncbi:hypothetical protein AYL99_08577 [Fonsecaea erecta]|uniref:Chromo domain-containing protein n=1 Tax=Fonsecaea erecta TaxID=1367422 RepID=A0A178ZDI5_9EURO|nr:hypothetical protein AYL99_08577 [Fonsecaea erecta]OAP57839.1 hypothetical protein AYL99_08577 [Fonsecaea erecta]